MFGAGGCCCADEPCCAQRLFRGAGSVSALTLTLESRQRWNAYSSVGCSNLVSPPTSTLSTQSMTLTHASTIDSAFLSGLFSTAQDYFTASEGWYLGPSTTLFAVSGDNAYTGTSTPITGKYFFAYCRIGGGIWCSLGAWLESDHTFASTSCGNPYWYGYLNLRDAQWGASLSHVDFDYGWGTPGTYPFRTLYTDQNPGAPVRGSTARAFIFNRFEFLSEPTLPCYPLLAEMEIMTQRRGKDCLPSHTPGTYLAPFRLAETATQDCGDTNPFGTNFSAISSTPPSPVSGLTGTHEVEEEFHILATLSE